MKYQGSGDYDKGIEQYIQLRIEIDEQTKRVGEAVDKLLALHKKLNKISDDLSGNAQAFASEQANLVIAQKKESK